MTAPQTEIVLQRTGLGQAWIALERLALHVAPQAGPLQRIGLLVGRVDLELAIACSN